MMRHTLVRVITAATMVAGTSLSIGAQGIPQRVADLEARLAALEQSQAPQTLSVDCSAGGSIMAALAQGAGRIAPLTIMVSGTCTEQITVARNDVTIAAAAPGAGLTAPAGALSLVFIRGGHRVRLIGLTLTGGRTALNVTAGASIQAFHMHVTGAFRGVEVTNASVELSGSLINHHSDMGVTVHSLGHATIVSSTVSENGLHGVFASGGMVSLRQTTVENNIRGGVFGWRGSSVHILGGVIRGNHEQGIAMQSGASVHTASGALVANNLGGISLSFGSNANLRDVTVENNTQAGISAWGGSSILFGEGVVIVRNNTGAGVTLSDTSVAGSFTALLQITGNSGAGIRCDGTPLVAQITSGSRGFSIGPAHVFGNSGPKQIDCPGF